MHRASLNHTYRLVWSDVENAFVAVAENVKGRGNSSRAGPALGAIGLVASCAILAGASGQLGAQTLSATLPTGGNVVAGSANIATSGTSLTVTQTTARMAADWQSFNIGQGYTVNFVQPTAASVALNRVLGADVSVIQGALNANGQVFLINPNGVLFTTTAQVNVGGIVASTLNLNSADFMAGNYKFEGASSNAIVNQGRITATGDGGTGGTVALIAAKITNTGTLTANQGSVLLGAGSKVTLDLGGPVKLQVEQGAIDALIEQGGAIRADGGLVYLSAKAANALAQSVINHSGVMEASNLTAKGGTVMLEADAITLGSGSVIAATGATGGGTVLVGGDWQGSGRLRQASTVTMESGARIDVSATQQGDGGTAVLWSDIKNDGGTTRAYGEIAAKGGVSGGNGGRIETSGHWLDVRGMRANAFAAQGAAGLWLLDPYNVTISGAASGTAYASTFIPGADSTILASDIVASLEGGTSVTITTGTTGGSIGDITVSSAITKTAGNSDVTLTLQAANTIVVDQVISNIGGTGKLNVALDADNNNGTRDGGGIIVLNNDISTGGGNITFGTGATMSINSVTTKVGGDVYVAGAGARSLTTGGGNVTVNGEMIIANTSGLSINTSNGNVTFGGLLNSGNSYADISDMSRTWSDAKTHAASGTGSGTGDTYLATITSRLENAIVSRTVNYAETWLGGRRVTGIGTDTQWRWVTGPEGLTNSGNGTPFFTQTGAGTGSTASGLYSNWSSGEPNNYDGSTSSSDYTQEGESVLQINGNLGQWNDLTGGPAGTFGTNTPQDLARYARETNLAASPLTISAGSGNVTFSGAVGSSKALASLNVTSTGTIAINGSAVTTEGLQTYNGNVTLGAAATTLTQTTAGTDFTFQSTRSFTNAVGGNATLLVRTTGDILMTSGSSITSSTGTLGVTFNSDSDGTAGGGIALYGATLNTNGGNVTFGGGTAGDGSGYAAGLRTVANYISDTISPSVGNMGITIGNSSIAAAGGNIAMKGQGRDGDGTVGRAKGIELIGDTGRNVSVTTTGSGTITFDGIGGAESGGGNVANYGINLNNSAGTGTITVGSQAGAISFTGVGGGSGTINHGVQLEGAGNTNVISSTGGAINITGTAGADVASSSGISSASNTTIGGASTTGAITLVADTAVLAGSYRSSGALVVQPLNTPTTIGIAGGAGTLALSAANFSTHFVDGFSSITVGRSDGTGAITTGAFTANDNLTLRNTTGGIAIGGALNTVANTLTLNSTGTVSQTAGITAGSLALLGTGGTHALTNTSNNVTTLAANTGSVAFYDSNTLAIGTVGATNGIAATAGTVLVETGTGDITISQNLSASSTGTSAIIVNAGKTAAAGTSTGGNVVLSGTRTFTPGAGGRAILYSGDSTASTGLSSLVTTAGGTLTYNADEVTTPAPSGGVHAIYRGADTTAVATTITADPAQQAAVQTVQTDVVEQSVTGTGFVNQPLALESTNSNSVLSGGLTFVDVPASSEASGQAPTPAAGDLQTGAGGLDASGFMRVFVVSGGINVPPGLVNTNDDDSTKKAK